MRRPSPALLVLAPAAAALLLSGCTSPTTGEAAGADPISVVATDTTCTLSATSAPAGPTTFAITNSGGQMTEFYIYDEAGSKIITEKPNIGPGISATLVYDFAPGTYTTACRPNGAGAGMRAAFTVAAGTGTGTGTGTVSQAAPSAELTSAVATYRSYIESETAALIPATERFAAAVRTGELARAKALFPAARQHYERIEPVAETFVDLDYAIDIREDGVEDGRPWTGWHAIEKILWVKNTTKGAEELAAQLVADTKKLAAEIPELELTPSLIGNGASGLMEEVAVGKVTGEEDRLLPHRHLGLRGQRGGSEGCVRGVGAGREGRRRDAHRADRGAVQRAGGRAGRAQDLRRRLSPVHRAVQGTGEDVVGQRECAVRAAVSADSGRRGMSRAPSLDPAGTPAGSEQGRGFSRRTALGLLGGGAVAVGATALVAGRFESPA